jgi:hypothetical protein
MENDVQNNGDDLKKNENGGQPFFFYRKTKMTNSKKWKMTFKKWMEDDLQKKMKMEDDLQRKWKWKTTSKENENGRRPHFL